MGTRQLFGVVGAVIFSAVSSLMIACTAGQPEETLAGTTSNVTSSEAFDKNALVTDAALRDASALTQADIQTFLESTPWGHASVLATYEENGKTAAEMLYTAAKKNGINPLELLVRLQMEQSLIYKETASEKTISLAFGCGCPHSPVCSPAYEGFGNQAECAAGTLSRSMDRAATPQGTASGWKTGASKKTEDAISITPKNAATAALYTYTPWVGEAGGGKKGVGGASLHHQIWTKFATAIGYDGTTTTPSSNDQLEPTPSGGGNDGLQNRRDAGTTTTPDPKPTQPKPNPSNGADAGSPSSDQSDESNPSPKDGDDDDDILAEGNEVPLSDAPLPKSSSKSRGDDGDQDQEASDPYWRTKRSAADSGCSTTTTGSGGGSSVLMTLVAGTFVIAARRRRSR